MSGTFDDIIRQVLGIQQVGDVVPMPGTRPSVDTYPTPTEKYIPGGFSPYMPSYDFDWHKILTPAPVNDASVPPPKLVG